MPLEYSENSIKNRCSHKILDIANKRIMFIDFGSLSNASFNNSFCRKHVFKLMVYPENNVDELIFIKPFKRIFNSNQISDIKEVSKKLNSFKKINLCEKCRVLLKNSWSDPLTYYYNLHKNKCKKCNRKTKKMTHSLEKTELIKKSFKIDNIHRTYSKVFSPVLIPEIVSAYIETVKPKGKLEKKYLVKDTTVSIHKLNHRPDNFYFINYPEINLTNKENNLINSIFEDICNLKLDINFHPKQVKKEFKKIIHGLIDNLNVKNKEIFFNIVYRHTIGYGSIEPLLEDKDIQDIYIDSGSSLVHIVHSEFGECLTNIFMTKDEIDKLITRLRANSGRPMDASNPVLHTEIKEHGIRVCGIHPPSTYNGTGFAFRRRKSEPWTLTEMIAANMLDHKTAGLLSYLIDGQNSLLITGPRSSGKTSLLTSLLLEIPQHNRIIIIEDTPEIPVKELRKLGFKIEHMKTEAFAKGFELSTEQALRTSLRLGDSVLVIGEVRGKEARALFEAMRVGASGNVVLGTIHGSSAYDTWDRVVNDLGVPSTSFKAVDNIITAGTIRSGDKIKRHRRILNITEIGKTWKDDPTKHMKDIVEYNHRTGKWKVNFSTSKTIRRISEMKCQSLHKTKKNIEIRAKIKKYLVSASKKNPKLISAKYVVASNNKFIQLASRNSNYNKVYREWKKWLRSVV
jgi:archaeal flagellar protein FlaI